jgi:type I restriction enzyme M protein
VYDLKAVNPNNNGKADNRTPAEIIASIEEQGKIVAQVLERLKSMLEEPEL